MALRYLLDDIVLEQGQYVAVSVAFDSSRPTDWAFTYVSHDDVRQLAHDVAVAFVEGAGSGGVCHVKIAVN